MNRRVFVAGALALGLAPAAAEPAHKRLIPLLIDLAGFEGRKADGRTLPSDEGAVTTASRFYVKDTASLHVTILSGPAVALDDALKPEAGAGHVTSEEIDGFRLVKTHNEADKSGALLIALDKTAAITADYRELAEDEAVALVRKFDWRGIAAAAK